MAPLKQALWHIRSALKAADAFTFVPAPRYTGGATWTVPGLAGTAVLWGLFLWFVVVSLAGFFGDAPPTARRTSPVTAEMHPMPALGITFRAPNRSQTMHDDRYLRVYFEQVTGYDQDLFPRDHTRIDAVPCDLSAWAGSAAKHAVCPAAQAYIAGGYSSPEFTFFTAHIVTCDPAAPFQYPNGTNVTCAPRSEIDAVLLDGVFELLQNMPTFDHGHQVETHLAYYDPDNLLLSESIYHKSGVVEPPSYVWSWTTQRVATLKLSSDKTQFVQRELMPSYGGGLAAVSIFARIDSFEVEEVRLQPNLLWLSGAWSAFYVTVFQAFALGLVAFAARQFYSKVPAWGGLGFRPFRAKRAESIGESLTAPTTVSEHRAGRAWRYHVFGALVFALEVALILACFVAKSVHDAGAVHVDPHIDVIAVRSCAVDLACGEANLPKPFSSAYRYVTQTTAADTPDGKTRLVVDGTGTQNCRVSLCMSYETLTTERLLEFSVEGSLLDLRLQDLQAFERPVRISGVRGVASKLWIRSPALQSFNASIPTGVVMVSPVVRSGHYNITVGFGPLIIAPTASRSGAFEATVTLPSPAAYCVNEGIRLSTSEVSRRTVDAVGNVTVLNETVVQTSAGIMRASALTIEGSASSLYVVRTAASDRRASAAMETGAPTIDPDTAVTLNGTAEWIDASNLNDYAQVVELVTPGLGPTFVNTDRRLILEFSPATLGMLTGFVLRPLYRRVLTTASHFHCRQNGTLADLFPDEALLTTVADAESVSVRSISMMLEQFLPMRLMHEVFAEVQRTAGGFTGVDSPAERHGGRPDHFKTFSDHFDTVQLIPVRMPFLVSFLIGLTATIAIVIIAGVAALLFVKRNAVADALLLRADRDKTARTYGLELSAPGMLYASTQQVAHLVAFHAMRLIDHTVSGDAAPFARFVRTHLQPANNVADALSLSELLEMYGSHCLSHFAVARVPTIEAASAVITAAGGSVADRKVAIASGVASVADVNCSRGMSIICGGRYAVTGRATDVIPVSHIANELGLDAATVTEELESAAGVKISQQSALMVLELEPRIDQRRVPFLHQEGLQKQAADLDVCMWSAPVYAIAAIPTRTKQRTRLDWIRALALWVGQAVITMCIYRLPAVVALLIVAAYDSENAKYSSSTDAIPLMQFDDIVLPTHGDANGGALQPFTFPMANLVFYLFIAFYVITAVELGVVSGLRFLRRSEMISVGFEAVLRALPTAGAAVLYAGFLLFDCGYALSVLMWWVLGAIISPGAMLAFCSATLALIAGLVGAYSSLQSNKKAVAAQMKERALEELTKLLKGSSGSIGNAELGDTLAAAGGGGGGDNGGESSENVEISAGLLLDIAGGEEAAIARLAGLLNVPPVLLRIAVAAAKKDVSQVDRCVTEVLELIEIDPAKYGKLASCAVLRGLSVPVPAVDVIRSAMPLAEHAAEAADSAELRQLVAAAKGQEIAIASFAETAILHGDTVDRRMLVNSALGILVAQLEPTFRDYGFARTSLGHLRDFAVSAGGQDAKAACASLDSAMMSVDLEALMSHVDHAWFSPAVAGQLRQLVHEVSLRVTGTGVGHIDEAVVDLLRHVLADLKGKATERFGAAIVAVQQLLDQVVSGAESAQAMATDADAGGVLKAAAGDIRLINVVRRTPVEQWPAVRQFYTFAFATTHGSVGDQLEVLIQRTSALTNTERAELRQSRCHHEAAELLRRAERAEAATWSLPAEQELPDLFAGWIAMQWLHLHRFLGAKPTGKQATAAARLRPVAEQFARHLGMSEGLSLFHVVADITDHAQALIAAQSSSSEAVVLAPEVVVATGPCTLALFTTWAPIRALLPIAALAPVDVSVRESAGLPQAARAVASLLGLDKDGPISMPSGVVPATVKDIVATAAGLRAVAAKLHGTLEYQLAAPFAQITPKELSGRASASSSAGGADTPLMSVLVATAVPHVTTLVTARASPSKNHTPKRIRDAIVALVAATVPDPDTNTASHHLLDVFQTLGRTQLGGKPGNDLASRLRDLPVTAAQLDMLFDATLLVPESAVAQLVIAAVSDQHLRSTSRLVQLRASVLAQPKARRDVDAVELLDTLITDWKGNRGNGGSLRGSGNDTQLVTSANRWYRLVHASRRPSDTAFDAALRECLVSVPSSCRLLTEAVARALRPGALTPNALALIQRRLSEAGVPRIVLDMSITLMRIACGHPPTTGAQHPPMGLCFDTRARHEQRLFHRREVAVGLCQAAYRRDFEALRCLMEACIETLLRNDPRLTAALAPTARLLHDVDLDVVAVGRGGEATQPASERLRGLFKHPLEHLLRIAATAVVPSGGFGVRMLLSAPGSSSDDDEDDGGDHDGRFEEDAAPTPMPAAAAAGPTTAVERMMLTLPGRGGRGAGTGDHDDLAEPLMTEMMPVGGGGDDTRPDHEGQSPAAYNPPPPTEPSSPMSPTVVVAPAAVTASVDDGAALGLIATLVRDNHADAETHLRVGMASIGGEPLEFAVLSVARLLHRIATPGPVDAVEWLDAALDFIRFVVARLLPMAVVRGRAIAEQAHSAVEDAAAQVQHAVVTAAEAVEAAAADVAEAGASAVDAVSAVAEGNLEDAASHAAEVAASSTTTAPAAATAHAETTASSSSQRRRTGTMRRTSELDAFLQLLDLISSGLHGEWPGGDAGAGALSAALELVASRASADADGASSAALDMVAEHVPPMVSVLVDGLRDPFTTPTELCLRLLEHIAALLLGGTTEIAHVKRLVTVVTGIIEQPTGKAKRKAALKLVVGAAQSQEQGVGEPLMLLIDFAGGDLTKLVPLLELCGSPLDHATGERVVAALTVLQQFAADRKLTASAAAGVAKEAFVDAFIDHVFHQFDVEGRGRIDFNSFAAVLRRAHVDLPQPDQRALFAKADADGSGFIDKREFRAALDLMQEAFMSRALETVGLTDAQITAAVAVLAVYVVLFLVFILVGIVTFTDGSQFTTIITGGMPMLSTGLKKLTSPGSLQQLLQMGDKAVVMVFERMQQRAGI